MNPVKTITYAAVISIVSQNACAYIDPGTGGMIVGGLGGAIYALIVGAFAFAAGLIYKFFNPIKEKINNLIGSKKDDGGKAT
jgi:hypothetical protein